MRSAATIVAFGLGFLFFVQSAAVLVQSVYILDLMNLELDLRAAGLLFFFSPILPPLLRGRPVAPRSGSPSRFCSSRAWPSPGSPRRARLLGSGLAVAASLLLLPLAWTGLSAGRAGELGLRASQGFALSIALSILLRALGQGLDASLEAEGGWIGLLLGLALLSAFSLGWRGAGACAGGRRAGASPWSRPTLPPHPLLVRLSSPGVIARWTGLPEPPISIATSLLALGWIVAAEFAGDFALRLDRRILGIWNAAFVAALAALLALNTPAFPPLPTSSSLVGAPARFEAPPRPPPPPLPGHLRRFRPPLGLPPSGEGERGKGRPPPRLGLALPPRLREHLFQRLGLRSAGLPSFPRPVLALLRPGAPARHPALGRPALRRAEQPKRGSAGRRRGSTASAASSPWPSSSAATLGRRAPAALALPLPAGRQGLA